MQLPMRSALFAILALCLSAFNAPAALAKDQVAAGVEIFVRACLDELPDFTRTGERLVELGAKENRGNWSIPGKIWGASVRHSSSGTSCLVTINAPHRDVVFAVSHALNKRYGRYDLVMMDGAPRALVTTSQGRAAVTIVPDPSDGRTTLLAQSEPKN